MLQSDVDGRVKGPSPAALGEGHLDSCRIDQPDYYCASKNTYLQQKEKDKQLLQLEHYYWHQWVNKTKYY